MILDELVLHNFGVYRGRQSFELSPQADRPIILIGAQNGGGKTTFLEGLQLALYGRLTQSGIRGSSSYDAYLAASINRHVSPKDGAEVQLTFRRTIGGREHTYVARRCWSVQKSGVRETFEVLMDGSVDRVLTAQWAEFVEDLLPPRIAPLFFFDGEKIEQFADLTRSAEIISVAVRALLGLDIVERLQLDLDVLERRKLGELAKADGRAELAAAEKLVNEAKDRFDVLHQSVAAARTKRDRQAALLERAKETLQGQGGGLFIRREALAEQRSRVEHALEQARKDARHWAAEAAPLLLVQDLVSQVALQADDEVETQAAQIMLRHLDARDHALLSHLRGFGSGDDLIGQIDAFLRADRQTRVERAAGFSWLKLSPHAHAGVRALLGGGFDRLLDERSRLLDRLDALEAERDDVERNIASIPAAETIAPLVEAVRSSEDALVQAEAELIACERDFEAGQRELAAARARYQAGFEQQVRSKLAHEDTDRLIQHSAKARATLAAFKKEVISHHVHRLERLILEALGELLRKSDLVADIKIDPETFALEIRDGAWRIISPEHLSAGERQLLAVALLWALAKASEQAAPTVIDTPLGRLDSQHRARLVDRYFPYAGDQVILLSTDQEIDEELYARLAPKLSRTFTIAYDPTSGGSQVRPGYEFAGQASLEAA